MTKGLRWAVFGVLVALGAGAALHGCAVTGHATARSALGAASTQQALEASLARPGVVELTTVASADWAVERQGLINLEHPVARDAGLVDGDEPIHVAFHALRHPTRGLFIIDTGVERALRDAPERSAMSGLVRAAMHLDKLRVRQPLGDYLADAGTPLRGVFLTHLHLDHLTGMRDVPADVPVYTGLAEAQDAKFMYVFSRGSTEAALEGKGPLQEWPFPTAPGASADGFDAVVDVFGDGSVWALWVPGHTRGSTAYLVNATSGPVLFTGDACHTRWGWDHGVEPGTFTNDRAANALSLKKLLAFAKAHPQVEVRVGHQ